MLHRALSGGDPGRLLQLVRNDLHGPLGGEHEEFGRQDPLDRYPLGRLAARGEVVEPDTQDDLAEAEPIDPRRDLADWKAFR
jgi:hypothetical protein